MKNMKKMLSFFAVAIMVIVSIQPLMVYATRLGVSEHRDGVINNIIKEDGAKNSPDRKHNNVHFQTNLALDLFDQSNSIPSIDPFETWSNSGRNAIGDDEPGHEKTGEQDNKTDPKDGEPVNMRTGSWSFTTTDITTKQLNDLGNNIISRNYRSNAGWLWLLSSMPFSRIGASWDASFLPRVIFIYQGEVEFSVPQGDIQLNPQPPIYDEPPKIMSNGGDKNTDSREEPDTFVVRIYDCIYYPGDTSIILFRKFVPEDPKYNNCIPYDPQL